MHAIPMSTINHENNILLLLLVQRGAVKVAIESEGVNKYTVIWKVCTVFLVKISGNFQQIKISGKSGVNFRKFSELTTLHRPIYILAFGDLSPNASSGVRAVPLVNPVYM